MAGGSGRGHDHPIPATPAGRRHVWVRSVDDTRVHAGILIDWRKDAEGWRAEVAYVLDEEQVLVQQWLPASLVQPVGPLPRTM